MTLLENAAHIFLISAADFKALCLSPEEEDRAGRFRFPEHRDTFSATRSALRVILARYLQCDPSSIRFSAGPNGKLFLEQPQPAVPIHFNVSHSERYAVVAVTDVGRVGVDLEKIRLDTAETDIAKRYFSQREQEWLLAHSENDRKQAFFRLWVLKEAILKADGRGLSMPLSEAEIEFTENGPRAVSGDWWVQELRLIEGFTSAIACSHQCRLLIMDS